MSFVAQSVDVTAPRSSSQTKSAVIPRAWSHMLPLRRTILEGTFCTGENKENSDWVGQRQYIKQREHYLISHLLTGTDTCSSGPTMAHTIQQLSTHLCFSVLGRTVR